MDTPGQEITIVTPNGEPSPIIYSVLYTPSGETVWPNDMSGVLLPGKDGYVKIDMDRYGMLKLN
jgi:hypothetical protein